MSRPMTDIVEEWVGLIPNTFKAYSMTSGVLTVCSTHWAVVNAFLYIGVDKYKILEVVKDTTITIKATLTNASEFEYTLERPYYIHGTPKQATTDKGLVSKADQVKTTPLIYLFEPIEEDFNEELNPVEREVDLRIGVLSNYKNSQTTNELYNYSVYAMRSLAEAFIETVKGQVSQVQKENVTSRIKAYPKYSNNEDRNGGTTNIFNENLSGIDLVLDVPMKRIIECEC